MPEASFTVIDEGRVARIPAAVSGGSVRLSPAALRAALGWELRPEGLCKDRRCVAVRDRTELVTDAGADLARVAALLARPIAIDTPERVAYVGAAAADRGAQLSSLLAPDFTLPDLAGRPHALSDHRGKKVLLVAYASW